MGERAKAINDLKNALKKQSPQLNRLKRQNAKASLREWKAAGKL